MHRSRARRAMLKLSPSAILARSRPVRGCRDDSIGYTSSTRSRRQLLGKRPAQPGRPFHGPRQLITGSATACKNSQCVGRLLWLVGATRRVGGAWSGGALGGWVVGLV
jgi:hypothetical protein